MHLVAKRDLLISSPYLDKALQLEVGEAIHTENSHKYTSEHIREIVDTTGLQLNHTHTDAQRWFALTEFQKR